MIVVYNFEPVIYLGWFIINFLSNVLYVYSLNDYCNTTCCVIGIHYNVNTCDAMYAVRSVSVPQSLSHCMSLTLLL